ncbi:GNAT family N-acetyltransferase [Roseivivax isoporae]|uniref:L-ornithine N(alpha)-acyltransferase n=1 Tax=Roseivivax isoporae LMG 25204 TaxID=1449351 RepID=X7FF00_9RHOB|nr:GNAT family N-acetyltransferase [Roseivivax isoporae]ETX30646.1 ornithine-acyl-ACP acyltransferase [Roseivivax isoporae LMG 25204]
MLNLVRGRYAVRTAAGEDDVARAQRLRHLCFRGNDRGLDRDGFDPVCVHVLIEERATGRLVSCFRLLPLSGGAEIEASYAAQFYGLAGLRDFTGPMVEMGRFCIHPEARDADILRVAWGALTAYVDGQGVELMFGCASFAGTDTAAHLDAFALLGARHLAPRRWLPRIKAPDVFRYAQRLASVPADARKAMAAMPPLLRTYLAMGGWVSDHAVVDRDLDTLHVFTGVEIGRIPPARKRILRAVAGRDAGAVDAARAAR